MKNAGKYSKISAAIALSVMAFAAVSSARAGVVTLNFALSDLSTYGLYEPILNYYDGGADAGGAIGPNYGITFNAGAAAQNNYPYPGSNVGPGNNPAPGIPASMILYNYTGDIMNVAAGFTTGFSFYYSAPFATGTVNVYAGLNGTGALLASLVLPLTPNADPPYPYNYGIWDPFGVAFAGTAESVNFSGSYGYIAFDDVTLGAASPVVPDVTGVSIYAFAVLGLVGMAWVSRKQKAIAL